MEIDIQYKPAHSLARVSLQPGETIEAEAGAMVGMSHNVTMTTSAGGAAKGFKRLFGGESFFRNQFTAEDHTGEVLLAPSLCGDMVVLDVEHSPWFIQSSSYVASSTGVELNTQLGGFKTFFAGEGLFLLQASGSGQVLTSAFGALERIDVDGSVVIDTGHLVAWQDIPSLRYRVTKASTGWIASYLSGEGLICEFEGHGAVWIQTRNPSEYGRLMGRILPARSR